MGTVNENYFLQRVNQGSNLKQTGSFLIEQNSIPRELSKRFQLDVKLETWNSYISLSSLGKNNMIIWSAQRVLCSVVKCLPFEIDQNCNLQYKNFILLICVEGWSEYLLGRSRKKESSLLWELVWEMKHTDKYIMWINFSMCNECVTEKLVVVKSDIFYFGIHLHVAFWIWGFFNKFFQYLSAFAWKVIGLILSSTQGHSEWLYGFCNYVSRERINLFL